MREVSAVVIRRRTDSGVAAIFAYSETRETAEIGTECGAVVETYGRCYPLNRPPRILGHIKATAGFHNPCPVDEG